MNSRFNIKRLALVILLLGLGAVGAWSLLQSKRDTGTVAATPASQTAVQRVTVRDGMTVVTLDAATQALSGIRSEPLSAANDSAEIAAYGTVLDLQPLLDLRVRYDTARADADTARATLAASRQEYERSRLLYQDNQNVSLKIYQAAQAAYLSDQARAEAAALNAQNIRAAVWQQFGEKLGRWAFDSRSTEFARLLQRKEVLLRVTLPLDVVIVAPARIQISASDNRRLPAYLVAPSPQSDPAIQGNAFIYRTATPLASGTQIAAYLPTVQQATRGILVPASAIVWYGGQAWAYVQINTERFGRYPVAQQVPMQGGFFVTKGFKPEQRVVVSGAQLLLSEELRPPPGSSGCKDPECD